MASDRVVLSAVRQERVALRRALWAGLLVGLSTVGLAGTSAWLIVRAAQHPAVLSLTVPMGLVQLFALSKAAGRYLERIQTHEAALSVMGRVRASIASLLEPLIPAGLGPRSSDVVDLVLRDVDRVQDLLTAVVGPLLTSAAAGVITVVVTGLVVPWSAAWLMGCLVLTAIAVPMAAARMGERSEIELEDVRARMVRLFDAVAQGGDELVMHGDAARVEMELASLERRYDVARRRHTRMEGIATAVTSLIASASVVGAVLLSARALERGSLSPSLVAIPALLSVAALELVGGIVPIMVGLRGDRASLDRLEGLGDIARPVHEPDGDGPSTQGAASVHLVNASLRLGDDTVISHASLGVAPGDFVVVSGPSGSGKTSIARLLAKFVDPTDGAARLDDVDYRDLTSVQVRARVGSVDDAPHVFDTTLAGNLRIGRPNASDDELRAVCRLAGLEEFVDDLPDGLDTELGGLTTGLSGGEQRRLGVAREMLAARPVVIFDEPSEGLDEEMAAKVIDSIARRYRHDAVIVISHRGDDQRVATRTLRVVDGVVLDGSRVDDAASHG